MTAKTTLSTLSALIATSLPPVPGQEAGVDGRRAATAASFAQLAEIGGDASLTEADAKAGFSRLGTPQEGDTPPIAARRLTCRQVADLLCPTTERPGRTARLASVFEAVVTHFQGSDDPRQKAMAATAAREAAELRKPVGVTDPVADAKQRIVRCTDIGSLDRLIRRISDSDVFDNAVTTELLIFAEARRLQICAGNGELN